MRGNSDIGRRDFIKQCSYLVAGMSAASGLPAFSRAAIGSGQAPPMEARWYEKLPYKKIRCRLCPRECVIDDGERGYCGVRENRGGIYYTLVHSRPCTYHVDPIEKKPLFHFLPGSRAFSLATVGCNVDCKFCQNWQISQIRPEQARNLDMPPGKVAEMARSSSECLAFTYSEPVVFSEYVYDCAKAGMDAGLKSVMVTNGYINEDPMRDLIPALDAVKVDLKAFSEVYYRDVVSGELQPVLKTLVLLKDSGIWLEIVYLMVPGLNDGEKEVGDLSRWMIQNLGSDVPLHFTRFYPQYKLQNLPPTPVKTLESAREIALAAGLKYVYIGNIPGHPAENTYCPGCGETIVERNSFVITQNRVRQGCCPGCGLSIPGVWS